MADDPTLSGTVLVVDDAPDSLRFLVATLESVGLRVLIATDGQAALELLEHAVPDLVLMDAMMPGLDGFETTRAIKREPRWQHLPVIFMTGLTEEAHVLKGFAAGGADYVMKPIVIDVLLARIRAHLASARVTQSSVAALDSTGRPLLVLDPADAPVWVTPRADAILARCFDEWAGTERRFPPAAAQAVRRLDTIGGTTRIDVADGRIEFTLISQSAGERLLLLAEAREGEEERVLAQRHGLTSREAEVLLWISRGKPNREISDILGISPRTVNKHLEQIFEKLGVENRASAAAFAVQTLSRWR